MMCESAGQGDARTGLFSATFTLSGLVNATLRASSHFFFFQNTGAVWLGWGKGDKWEQSGCQRLHEKRGCCLNLPNLLGIGFQFQMSLQYSIFAQCQCCSRVFSSCI